jgi:hypothetical protein
MTTQQQMILDAIEKRVAGAITIDYTWGNVGFIRNVDPTTLAATRSLAFDFGSESCTFKTPSPNSEIFASCWYGKPRREGHIPAVKSTPGEVVDAVVAYLNGGT